MKSLDNIETKSYSIIGANSYLSRHIVNKLKKYNFDFCLYDVQPNSFDGYSNYTKIDITQKNTLENVNFDVDYVFVFSGLTGTHSGFDNYENFIDVNEKGLLNILDLMMKKKSKARIIFPSSRLVYKGITDRALKENDEKELKTIYAANKYCCEEYLKMYQNCFGLNYTIFRICVPYGNEIDKNLSYGTMGHFLSAASQGRDIHIYGNGMQKRSFIYIDDIVNQILLAIQLDETKNDILNIGGPDVLSIEEVAKSISVLYGIKVLHKDWPELLKKIESGDTIFDSSKIEHLLNYKYKYIFRKWIDEQAVILNRSNEH